MEPMRVAVVQAGSAVFRQDACLSKVESFAAEAAEQGARFVLFPEAFVGGYPKGLDFGARVGSRTVQGREDFLRYFEAAVEVPGPVVDRLSLLAVDLKIYLVVGVIERDGGTLYCTVLFFGPDGSYLGKHRKLMPTAAERLVWGFGDGSTLPVLDTPAGKMGAVICWENYMPLLRTYMYSQEIAIYCAPTADDRETWLATMRHIALEGRCFVLTACQYLTRADCPDDYDAVQGSDPATVLMRGGSAIINPLGKVLAGPNMAGETILVADLDPAEIARGKYDFDVTGNYSRPDVFQLQVNKRPQSPVTSDGEEPA
jgi:nitrilase